MLPKKVGITFQIICHLVPLTWHCHDQEPYTRIYQTSYPGKWSSILHLLQIFWYAKHCDPYPPFLLINFQFFLSEKMITTRIILVFHLINTATIYIHLNF